MARLVLVLCLCGLATYAAAAGAGGPMGNRLTAYTELDSLKGQWAITVESTRGSDAFKPVTCDVPAFAAPCNQPPLSNDAHDKVRVTAKQVGKAITTRGGLAAADVILKLCFSKPSTADRPWRKANDVIDKDRACPQTLATLPIAANGTYSAVWPVPKAAVKATWYAQVLVECKNGTELTVCQYDNTANKTYVSTQIMHSTPVSLQVAAAVCSAIAPAVLVAFFIKEQVLKKRA
jgi:hypothetical protein